jgi:hypothetical protein
MDVALGGYAEGIGDPGNDGQLEKVESGLGSESEWNSGMAVHWIL